MTVIVYHNPGCTKSRQTLDLLRSKGIEPEIVEYLKTPPTKQELLRILKFLGVGPREFMRKGEGVYKEQKLDDPSLTHDQLVDAIIKYPILIERPVVITKAGAAIGRPPENVLKLFAKEEE